MMPPFIPPSYLRVASDHQAKTGEGKSGTSFEQLRQVWPGGEAAVDPAPSARIACDQAVPDKGLFFQGTGGSSKADFTEESVARPEIATDVAPGRGAPEDIDLTLRAAETSAKPSQIRWIGEEGELVSVGGVPTQLCQIHVGTGEHAYDALGVIALDLPLDVPAEPLGEGPPYWRQLYPEARRQLAAWISIGRLHAAVSPGAIAHYCFSLERRLVLERAWKEAAGLKAILEAIGRDFEQVPGISRWTKRLIDVCYQLDHSLAEEEGPSLEPNPADRIRHGVKVGLGRRLAVHGSLDSTESLVLLTNLPGMRLDTNLLRHWSYLETMWHQGHREYFPDGLFLRSNLPKLNLRYASVIPGHVTEIPSELPDVEQAELPQAFYDLFEQCRTYLAPLANKSRSRRGNVVTINKPRPKGEVDPLEVFANATAARSSIEAFIGDEEIAVTRLGSLLDGVFGLRLPPERPLTRRVRQGFGAALLRMGFTFEPDRDGGATFDVTPDTQVAIARLVPGERPCHGPVMELGQTAVSLSCLGSACTPGLTPLDYDDLISRLPGHQSLSSGDLRQLKALRAALLNLQGSKALLEQWAQDLIRQGRREYAIPAFEIAFHFDGRSSLVERFARQLCLALGLPRADAEYFLRSLLTPRERAALLASRLQGEGAQISLPQQELQSSMPPVDPLTGVLADLEQTSGKLEAPDEDRFVEPGDSNLEERTVRLERPVKHHVALLGRRSPASAILTDEVEFQHGAPRVAPWPRSTTQTELVVQGAKLKWPGLSDALARLLSALLAEPVPLPVFSNAAAALRLTSDGALEALNLWGCEYIGVPIVREAAMLRLDPHVAKQVEALGQPHDA